VKSADFVLAHHAAVTLYVGTQDGYEFALNGVFSHVGTLIFEVLNRVD